MAEQKIEPSKIRTPIQLLAAWLLGLILVDGSFLGAAAALQRPDWASGCLVIAAISNVPLFLISIFLLQTRFRPEMQEDEYYSQYLERRYSSATGKEEVVKVNRPEAVTFVRQQPTRDTPRVISHVPKTIEAPLSSEIAVNDLLPAYQEIVTRFRHKGISIDKTFGSTSNEPKVPKPFVVTITLEVEAKALQAILLTIKDLGLEGVGLSSKSWGEPIIYIGAYSYNSPGWRYLPLTEKNLSLLLADEFSKLELHKLLRDVDNTISMTP